jgi:hypothetical protein
MATPLRTICEKCILINSHAPYLCAINLKKTKKMRKSSNELQREREEEKLLYETPTVTLTLIELEGVVLLGSVKDKEGSTSLDDYDGTDSATGVDGLDGNGDYLL